MSSSHRQHSELASAAPANSQSAPVTDGHEVLCEADCAALEALVDAGFDVMLVPPALRQRAEKAARILGLACSCPGLVQSPHLTDLTLARVGSAAPAVSSRQPDQLEWEDEEAVDAYVMSGYRCERVPASLRPRARKLQTLASLLTSDILSRDTNFTALADRTLAAVSRTPMNVAEPSGVVARIGGIRLADVFSVAAVAVLGVSVLWPVLSTLRSHSIRSDCGNNMRAIAGALGSYAGDYRDSMPIASASLAGATWWDVGTTPGRSNSANLFQLPKLHYASLTDFACAGNASAQRTNGCDGMNDWGCRDEVSYSYQVMFGETRPRWGERAPNTASGAASQAGMPMIVLTDKSPVVMRATRGQKVYVDENSTNHGGDGQWALRSDGSAAWLSSPNVGDDNIWLPCVLDRAVKNAREELRAVGATAGTLEVTLTGNELSRQPGNTFVGP
jgi:hypothetical protein